MTGWRGRKAKTLIGCAHLERLVSDTDAEVVDFIDNQELETLPETRHKPVGAFERRNRDPFDDPPAIAEATNRAAMNIGQRGEPLLEQGSRGDQA